MRDALAVVLVTVTMAHTVSWADMTSAQERTLPHQKKCSVPLPDDFWTDKGAEAFKASEKWAWNRRICLGKVADMRNAPGGRGTNEKCSPEEIEGTVPDYRKLRPEFLELVLNQTPWTSAPKQPKVSIQCALVSGNVDQSYHAIEPAFSFRDGKIAGSVSLFDTAFKRSLSFSGSAVSGTVNADNLQVGGDLFLQSGGTFADIYLINAKIARNASFSSSTVTGKINAGGLRVGGDLNLREGATFANIHLLDAKVSGNVSFSGSTVTGKINANNLKVGGDLNLREGGTFADIHLFDAKITGSASLGGSTVAGTIYAGGLQVGGSLFLQNDGTFNDINLINAEIIGAASFNGSTFTGMINADNMKVGGDLFLQDGGTFADINLINAEIGKHVQLYGGTFRNTVDFTGATIKSALRLSSLSGQSFPEWKDGAMLILRNAKTDELQAVKNSWKMSAGDQLLPTDLTGFTYTHLGRPDTPGAEGMGDAQASWLTSWIKAQHDYGQIYDPQPYTQLAQTLEAVGSIDKAKAIRYAKFEHRRSHDTSVSFFPRLWLWAERSLIGYGVYPFRALYWFVGVVLLGGVFVQFSQQPSVRRWMGLWYSLENALPLVATTERFKNVEHGKPLLTHFFHFQRAFGFFLATILVGALTLLSG